MAFDKQTHTRHAANFLGVHRQVVASRILQVAPPIRRFTPTTDVLRWRVEQFSNIRVTLPSKYGPEDAARLKTAFPGVHVVLGGSAFGIEEELDGDAPSKGLKQVFSWIEGHL